MQGVPGLWGAVIAAGQGEGGGSGLWVVGTAQGGAELMGGAVGSHSLPVEAGGERKGPFSALPGLILGPGSLSLASQRGAG